MARFKEVSSNMTMAENKIITEKAKREIENAIKTDKKGCRYIDIDDAKKEINHDGKGKCHIPAQFYECAKNIFNGEAYDDSDYDEFGFDCGGRVDGGMGWFLKN